MKACPIADWGVILFTESRIYIKMDALNKLMTTPVAAELEVDWESAYKELLPKIHHYFCLRIGDHLEAEDLTASTFERAWRNRNRFRNDIGTFSNWLFGIARHVAVSHFREYKPTLPLEDYNRQDAPRPTEESATANEEFKKLASRLALLPEREREIFSLKYGAQFTNRAIAEVTSISESNVGTILHRMVKQLRKDLEIEP